MRGLVFGSVLMVCVLGSVSALATDTKIYPGSFCHSTGSQYWENNGSWQNTGTGLTRTVCPIVRDEWGFADDVTVKIFVYDPASGSGTDFQVRCWVRTAKTTGSIIDSVYAETSASGTGNSTLTFTGLTPGPLDGNAMSIDCWVPPDGRIRSYQATEGEQVD